MPNRRRLVRRLGQPAALALALAALAIPCRAAGADDAEAFRLAGPPRTKVAKPPAVAPSQRLHVDVSRVPVVALGRIDRALLDAEDAINDRKPAKVIRFGLGRDVTVGDSDGAWTELADGSRLWVAEVMSAEAMGLRLHFADVNLPQGAELTIYATDLGDANPAFNPPEVHHGSAAAKAVGSFWTGSIPGERARVEYLAKAGSGDGLPFRIDRLQHLYRDPKTAAKLAGSCEQDAACFGGYENLAKSEVGIGFIGDDALYCSMTILNDSNGDFTPYGLTANHCLSTQGDASSTEAFFGYETSSCGGSRPSIFSVPRASGFSLMSTNPASDYTLVIIDGSIPSSQVVWAGWTSAVQGSGVATVGVHHPSGDVKKISFGETDFSLNCSGFGIPTIPNFWTGQGVTEPGSSGSGLFKDDFNQQLIGQLFGGPSFCGVSDSGRFDCYGPFSTTFARIKTLLAGGTDDKSEQNDSCAKARVLKRGTQTNRVLKINDADWYKYSVPAHKTVIISLGFYNQFGDIDLETFASCGGSPIAVSNGTDDGEAVSITNVGSKPAWLYIHPFFGDEDTRAIYNISIQ